MKCLLMIRWKFLEKVLTKSMSGKPLMVKRTNNIRRILRERSKGNRRLINGKDSLNKSATSKRKRETSLADQQISKEGPGTNWNLVHHTVIKKVIDNMSEEG